MKPSTGSNKPIYTPLQTSFSLDDEKDLEVISFDHEDSTHNTIHSEGDVERGSQKNGYAQLSTNSSSSHGNGNVQSPNVRRSSGKSRRKTVFQLDRSLDQEEIIFHNQGVFPGTSTSNTNESIQSYNICPITPQQIWNNILYLNEKKPRFFTALLLFCVFILPLLIYIWVVSNEPPEYIFQAAYTNTTSHNSSTTTTTKTTPTLDPYARNHITSEHGVVASDTKECSQIGADILRKGGNAVDAAIAVAFCLSVQSPASSGIGGGGFLLLHNAVTNTQEFIDAREVAPLAATNTMYSGNPKASQTGGLAIAVPGLLKGLATAYARQGSGQVPWADLLEPSIALAEHSILSNVTAKYLQVIEEELFSGQFPLLTARYVDSATGKVKPPGAVITQPTLAHTLRMIRDHGVEYIYQNMSETIAKEIQAAGGIITAEDIQSYDVTISDVLSVPAFGYELKTIGGSSTGGISLIGIVHYMNALSKPLVSLGLSYYHYYIECLKHVFAIRLHLGNPSDYAAFMARVYENPKLYAATTTSMDNNNTMSNPYEALFNAQYMAYLVSNWTSQDTVQPALTDYGGPHFALEYQPHAEAGTSHIAIYDQSGNAVSFTSTVNTYFGSLVISPSTGILWNNEMDDFSTPGEVNYYGLAPSKYNYPTPKKKPMSSMTPFILLDPQNRHAVRLIGGGSGGPRIITATAQVLLNYLGKGMSLMNAVITPRLHSQLIPNAVFVENATLYHHQPSIVCDQEIAEYLTVLGHANVTFGPGLGVTQYVAVETTVTSASATTTARSGWEGMWTTLTSHLWGSTEVAATMEIDSSSSDSIHTEGKKKYVITKTIQGISDPRKDGSPAAM